MHTHMHTYTCTHTWRNRERDINTTYLLFIFFTDFNSKRRRHTQFRNLIPEKNVENKRILIPKSFFALLTVL